MSAKARCNGVELAWELEGEGRETVVLLNGIGMSMAHWKPCSAILSKERSVLLSDLRGQLLSEKPAGPYSFELHAADLKALLDSLGISRAHIVGTSYGSEVGLAFARLYPEAAASLTVVDGVSEVHPLLRAAVASWKAAALAGPEAFFRSLIPWTYSERYIAANAALFDARAAAISKFPRDYFEAFASLCDAFLAIDETRHLGEIRCPTLVLVGSEDILKPRPYSEIIANGIAGARLEVLEGEAHGCAIENPAAVSARILAFLGSLGRT
jgi:3-oxoadipate enol-lactonase